MKLMNCALIFDTRKIISGWFMFGKESKTVVSFNVGKQTNKTLNRVLETLKLSTLKRYLRTG
jgi:insertion element IS1 protein InsB